MSLTGARWLSVLLACAGCREAAAPADVDSAPDAAPAVIADASVLPPHDSGRPAPEFEPAEPSAPIPAHNENDASTTTPDASLLPDAAPVVPPPPTDDCLAVPSGETLKLEAELLSDALWQRIGPDDGCPATLLTAVVVAYAPFALCSADEDRILTVSMRGADMLLVPRSQSVANPMLAVYAEESFVHDDPFECLAVNDDGTFGGEGSDSARIEALHLPAKAKAVVIATSYERPDQHGLGTFELEISAE